MASKKPERSPKKTVTESKQAANGKQKPAKAQAKSGKDPASSHGNSDGANAAAAAKANGKSAKEALISLGKSKGFLTYDDVHDALPGDEVGPDQMDDVLSSLDDEDIEVVDDASNIKIAPHRSAGDDEAPSKAAAKTGDDEPAESGAGATPSTPPRSGTDDDYYKSNDPVRMYLRKMGSVALLTREGEVEIAKRIEEGENEVLS